MKNFDLSQAVAAYVPSHVVRRVLAGSPPRPAEAEPIEAAVLFADIAGFTTMSERMVRMLSDQAPHQEHRGSEELNRLLNQTFSALMQPVLEYGGVVSRFSGDALTAYFERGPNDSPGDIVAGALACAWAMQRAVQPFSHAQVTGHEFPISVKIGVSYGPALRLTVGDVERGLEPVLAGPAVDMVTQAEKHAHQGEVVASQAALAHLDVPPPISEVREAFAVVAEDGQPVSRPPGNSSPDLSNLDEAARQHLLKALAPYLPSEVYSALALTGGDLPGDFRRVTSIFVGFEGLQYDSPRVGIMVQDYFTWAQNVVTRFEGRLNRVITGDKGSVLHILFGAPGKHDDDLVRALRCALTLQNDPDRPAHITSQRIGIASGIVLARPVGSDARREYTVIGDEINLSSRLMTAGAAGDILVDSYTRDRTAQRFTFESLPLLQLKGKQYPVKAYRLQLERPAETGLTARYLASRWALVGRDAECAALLATAGRALAGQGNVMAISGRTGVGKTRLVEEVVRHWVDNGGNGYMGQSQSHGLNSPYLPWVDLWRVFFDFHESEDVNARWQKVEALVAAEAGEMQPWAGILGAMLGLPAPESQAIAALDAAERRNKLFDLVLALLRTQAARRPLLVLFEDLHWADRPSLNLIDYVAARIADVPLLLGVCFRPRDDLDLHALSLPYCTAVALEELPPEASARMVRAVLRQTHLPAEFEREIYDKTQGNPLFVEELLNSLIDGGVLARDNGGYKVVGDLSKVKVPDTLQDLLMARIDRLEPSSRDLLQVASVIDRRFAYEILRGIYPYRMADIEMRDRLEATIQVDLTRLDHPEPELAYLFKHAMTYEVAYDSLPFERRRELHDRVGDFLEVAHMDNLEQYYPVLVRHYSQSECWNKTMVYALAAGAQAQELYANDEALVFYRQAEDCLARLPMETYWINALRLHLNRAQIYRLKGQYDLCEADINQALALAQTHEDTRAQAEAYNLLAELRWWQERNEEALRAAQLAYDLAVQAKYDGGVLNALRLLGTAYLGMAQFDRAMDYFLRAHDLASERGDQVTLGNILNAIGIAQCNLSDFDGALKSLQQALSLLETVELKHRVATCLTNIGMTQFRRGQAQAALDAYQRAIDIGSAGDSQTGVAFTYFNQAEVLSYQGKYVQALLMCKEALTVFRKTTNTLGEAYIQLLEAGEIALALELTAQVPPPLEAALGIMREYENTEQAMYALFDLAEYSLRSNNLHNASIYLQQISTLSQTALPVWPLSRQAWLEGCLALAQGNIEYAERMAKRIEELISQGSNPDVLGLMWTLRARIAQASNLPDETCACFEYAVQAVQHRGKFSDKLLVLKQAGAFLVTVSDAATRAQGQILLNEARAMQDYLEAEREQYIKYVKDPNTSTLAVFL